MKTSSHIPDESGSRVPFSQNESRYTKQTQSPAPSAVLRPEILLEKIDEAVCLYEISEGIRLTYARSAFYRMLGLDPDALSLPCELKDIGIHDDYAAEYELLLHAEASDSTGREHVHRIRDSRGDWIWRHTRISRIFVSGGVSPVLLEISRDITASMKTGAQLQESLERFQVAFGQSHSRLWEVTLSDRIFRIYPPGIDHTASRHIRVQNAPSGNAETTGTDPFYSEAPSFFQGEEFSHFPESLIANGLVHPDSAEPFLLFSENLLAGKDADTGNFIMKDRDGCYSWFSLSYRQICDNDRNPVKTIGIQERLPAVSGIFSTGFPRRPIPEALRHSLLARMHVNLSTDSVEVLWRNGFDQTSQVSGLPYSEILTRRDAFLFNQADDRELEKELDRQRLLELYENGERWVTDDYQRIDNGGNIRWLTLTFELHRDNRTGDIHLYACFCDSQLRHDWEALAETEIRHDPVSGLYTGQTAKALIESLLHSAEGSLCALALIHMNGSFLHPSLEKKQEHLRKRHFISIALSFALGMDCIVGQQTEDAVLVFFPNIASRFDVKKRVEDAFAYVHTVMDDPKETDAFRFISCGVVERTEDADLELLLSRVSSLCELYENAAMDTVAFPDMEEDWTWTGLMCQEPGEEEDSASAPDRKRSLTSEEQEIAFNCAVSMLNSRSLKASMEKVLRHLGLYHHASRLYVLALSEERQTVTMLYEWVSRQKYSIRHIMSGMQLEKFPLLLRCLKEKAPVTIKSSGQVFGTHEAGTFWYYTIFPLLSRDEITGFLCMENAREHPEEHALITRLLPLMKQEQQRYRHSLPEQSPLIQNSLSRLPNLHAYLDTIDSLSSDIYSSMGVLSLDIPNFSAINGNQGFEQGRDMLSHVAETLFDVFGKAFIFRTWDAEFVVLYPNTIMEVFVSRCTRVRTMLQRRYPGQIRVGHTWSDGIYTSKNLVKEARSIMYCENVREDPGERLVFLDENRFDTRTAASKDNLIAYFQPKIDMRDGSLAGAEALVRGVDKSGQIIPPGQFIETLEKNGTIRELDLIMLEKVMEQLSQWKRNGFPALNVSINISRFTLFNPTTLASILAIQSRFPDVSPEQIEFEITETAGDIEKATLASVIDSFQNYGLRFDLDDFGSHYANMSVFSSIRFHAIKLDRSLINGLPGNEISRMLVENIVQICKNFDMRCVAEGVETRQQEAALLEAGCIYAQGFYYARPLPPRKFEEQYLKKKAI